MAVTCSAPIRIADRDVTVGELMRACIGFEDALWDRLVELMNLGFYDDERTGQRWQCADRTLLREQLRSYRRANPHLALWAV